MGKFDFVFEQAFRQAYEPILIALPDVDKQGQIRKFSLTVQDDFDFVPSGAWPAERIWEPHLARDLRTLLGVATVDRKIFLPPGGKRRLDSNHPAGGMR